MFFQLVLFLFYAVPTQGYKYPAEQNRIIIHKWVAKYSRIWFPVCMELYAVAEEAVVLRNLFSHHFQVWQRLWIRALSHSSSQPGMLVQTEINNDLNKGTRPSTLGMPPSQLPQQRRDESVGEEHLTPSFYESSDLLSLHPWTSASSWAAPL